MLRTGSEPSSGPQRAMWYEQIADLYDALVQVDADIPFFVERAKAAGGPVIELMAGSGRVSIPVIEAGVELTCVDASPSMLAELRAKVFQKSLEVTVLCADVRRLDEHPWLRQGFELGFIAFNSLSELVDERERIGALRSAYDCLVPGGSLICTLHNPAVRAPALARRGPAGATRFVHPAGLGEVLFWLDADLDAASGVVEGVQNFETYAPTGELVDARRVDVRFCLPERAWLEAAAREVGFTVEELLGDYDGSPFDAEASPSMIWTLGK